MNNPQYPLEFGEQPHVLVTGASSGLGAALSVCLVGLGIAVTGVGRNVAGLEKTQQSTARPELFTPLVFDLDANLEDWPKILKAHIANTKPFSGYVHAAGLCNIIPVNFSSLGDMTSEYRVNYFAAVQTIQVLSSRKSHTPNLSIVLISSISAGTVGNPGCSTYASSKAALESLAVSYTLEIKGQKDKGHGMRINCIRPGNFISPMMDMRSQFTGRNIAYDAATKTVAGSTGTPQDIVPAILFLLSANSRWICGQTITVDGGEGLG